jgi:hypothetical protein
VAIVGPVRWSFALASLRNFFLFLHSTVRCSLDKPDFQLPGINIFKKPSEKGFKIKFSKNLLGLDFWSDGLACAILNAANYESESAIILGQLEDPIIHFYPPFIFK